MLINALPLDQAFTGGGSYCVGGTGVHIGLAASETGVSYQLYNAGSPIGAPMAGTGVDIDFGLFTTPGVYTMVATNTMDIMYRQYIGEVFPLVSMRYLLPIQYQVAVVIVLEVLALMLALVIHKPGLNTSCIMAPQQWVALVTGTGSAISFGSDRGRCLYR